ncbi:MAG: UbiA family prenyltransferase [bacterium]|nr:UbiA family prenyltransferase [bacterium]
MIRDYISMARPDHWFKNVFMLPGVILAWQECPPQHPTGALAVILLGVAAACLVCSSNYTINELVDAPEDRKHPQKKHRAAASGRVGRGWGYFQWALLGAAGLALSWIVGLRFLLTEVALLVMGLTYNVPPVRLKERPYVDVLSESVNNPLRLLLGWYAVRCPLVPPVSLLLSYWMLGCFFMAIKRFAEMKYINNKEIAAAYRKSFAYYTPERLLISIIFYATAFGLFGGIFLIRYRIELIMGVPVLAGFMAMYMRVGFQPNSPVQYPEKLYKQKGLVAYTLLTAVILIACLIMRIPHLSRLLEPTIPKHF